MRYSKDFLWVEDICRKVYLSVKHLIWGLKLIVVVAQLLGHIAVRLRWRLKYYVRHLATFIL